MIVKKALVCVALVSAAALLLAGCSSQPSIQSVPAGSSSKSSSASAPPKTASSQPTDTPPASTTPDATAVMAAANSCKLFTAADATALTGVQMSIFNSSELCAYIDDQHNWSVVIALSDLGNASLARGYVDDKMSMNAGSTSLALGDKGVRIDDSYGMTWTKTQYIVVVGKTSVTVTVQVPGSANPVPIADAVMASILTHLEAPR